MCKYEGPPPSLKPWLRALAGEPRDSVINNNSYDSYWRQHMRRQQTRTTPLPPKMPRVHRLIRCRACTADTASEGFARRDASNLSACSTRRGSYVRALHRAFVTLDRCESFVLFFFDACLQYSARAADVIISFGFSRPLRHFVCDFNTAILTIIRTCPLRAESVTRDKVTRYFAHLFPRWTRRSLQTASASLIIIH